jgi:hypothetical protein
MSRIQVEHVTATLTRSLQKNGKWEGDWTKKERERGYLEHTDACRPEFFLIPFYLQAVQIHLANGVKLLEAWREVLSSTPPYK